MEGDSPYGVYILYAMMIGLPSLFMAVGLGQMWGAWKTMRGARKVWATVKHVEVTVNHRPEEDAPTRQQVKTFRPVFEYYGPNGLEHAQAYLSGSERNYPEGTEMRIYVNPDNPTEARIPSIMIYGFGFAFFAAGAIFGALSLFAVMTIDFGPPT